jgi:uncharacterized membrane protein
MAWLLSLAINFIAIALTVMLVNFGTERWGPSPAAAIVMGTVVFAMLLGPYLVLAALSVFLRRDILLSRILCGLVLVICAAGLSALWFSIRMHLDRDPTVPGGSNWGPFLIGVALWLMSLTLFVILFPVGLIRKHRVATVHADGETLFDREIE